MQHRQGSRRQAQHLRRLGSHQLQHVGVVLLRHDRRPGAVFARQTEVGELRHGKENQIFGQARQNRHQLRERGKERRFVFAARHRRAKDVVERTSKSQQIACTRTIERQRHAIARRAAQRTKIVERVGRFEIGRLVKNHLGVTRRPHAHGGRHGRLEMRTPDERHAIMRAAKVHQRRREVGHFPFQAQQLILDVQAHIHGHLVVAAAARVDLLAEIAQNFRQTQLHCHVHVLVGRLDRKRGIVHDLGQLRAHARGLVLRHHGRGHGHFGQHRHMGRRAQAVPFHQVEIQYGIVAHRVRQHVGIDLAGHRVLRLCAHLFSSSLFRTASSARASFASATSSISVKRSGAPPSANATRKSL